jgi:hypothetical protein
VYVAFDPLDEARLRRELAAPVAAVATGKLAMRDLEHLPPTPENLALTRLDTAGGTCQG